MSGFLRSCYYPFLSKSKKNEDSKEKVEVPVVEVSDCDRNIDSFYVGQAYCAPVAGKFLTRNKKNSERSDLMELGDENSVNLIVPLTTEILGKSEKSVTATKAKGGQVMSYYCFKAPSEDLNESFNEDGYVDDPMIENEEKGEKLVRDVECGVNMESELSTKASEYIGFCSELDRSVDNETHKPTLVLKKPMKEFFNDFSNCSRHPSRKNSFFRAPKQSFFSQAPKVSGRAFEYVAMPPQYDSFYD